jgi:hypothetical protein
MLANLEIQVLLLDLHGPTSIYAVLPNHLSKGFPGCEPNLYTIAVFVGLLFSRFNF